MSKQDRTNHLNGLLLPQTLINGINIPIFVIDIERQVKLMNTIARECYLQDMRRDRQYCYQIIHNRHSPCIGAHYACPLELVSKTRQPVKLIHEHVWRDEEKHSVEIFTSPIFGKDGEVLGYIETITDITTVIETYVRLYESEQRILSIARTSSFAIVISDASGKIIFCNQAAENTFGYFEDEILGKPLTLIGSNRNSNNFQEQIMRLTKKYDKQSSLKTFELQGRRKNGNEIPLRLHASSWNNGEEVFYCFIFQDMNKSSETQEQALTQERHAVVEQLATGIVHEFSNILSLFSLYSDLLLKEQRLTPKVQEMLEIIQRQISQATSLTDQILDSNRKGQIGCADD